MLNLMRGVEAADLTGRRRYSASQHRAKTAHEVRPGDIRSISDPLAPSIVRHLAAPSCKLMPTCGKVMEIVVFGSLATQPSIGDGPLQAHSSRRLDCAANATPPLPQGKYSAPPACWRSGESGPYYTHSWRLCTPHAHCSFLQTHTNIRSRSTSFPTHLISPRPLLDVSQRQLVNDSPSRKLVVTASFQSSDIRNEQHASQGCDCHGHRPPLCGRLPV